eukprot:366559-Chlamydomonas_euryale.AAC.15
MMPSPPPTHALVNAPRANSLPFSSYSRTASCGWKLPDMRTMPSAKTDLRCLAAVLAPSSFSHRSPQTGTPRIQRLRPRGAPSMG